MSEAEVLKGLGIEAVDQDTIEKNVVLGVGSHFSGILLLGLTKPGRKVFEGER